MFNRFPIQEIEKNLYGVIFFSFVLIFSFIAGVYRLTATLYNKGLQENRLVVREGKLCMHMPVPFTTLFSARKKVELDLQYLTVTEVKRKSEPNSKFYNHTKIFMNDETNWIVLKVHDFSDAKTQLFLDEIRSLSSF